MFPELIERYRKAVVVIAVLLFFTNFNQYTEQFGIIPLYWIALLIVLIAPVMGLALLSRPLHITPIIWWMIGFLIISTLWYYRSEQTETNNQEVETRYLSMVFIILVLFLVSNDRDRLLARKTIVLASFVGIALNIYELFNPMTFSTIPGRSTGIYANVNQAGAALVLAGIMGFGVIPRRWRPIYLFVLLLGIIPTFSRGAMLGWGIAVVALYATEGVTRKELVRLLAAPAIIFLFILSPVWGGLQDTLIERGTLNADVRDRLNFFSPGSEGELQDESAREREELAALGFERFGMEPWLGWGTGAARRPPFFLAPHNIYILLMVDHGVIGILMFPALLLAIVYGVNRDSAKIALPLIAFLALWGIFSHNVLEEGYILISIAVGATTVDALRRRPAIRPLTPYFLPTRAGEPGQSAEGATRTLPPSPSSRWAERNIPGEADSR